MCVIKFSVTYSNFMGNSQNSLNHTFYSITMIHINVLVTYPGERTYPIIKSKVIPSSLLHLCNSSFILSPVLIALRAFCVESVLKATGQR